MKNKRLEERLKKYGTAYSDIIKMIEKCEAGDVGEIQISKKEKITKSPILDKMIFTYLKKLKVRIVFTEEVEPKSSEDERPKCPNDVHKVLGSDMKKSAKIKTLTKSKYSMFRIDVTSFVVCPECGDIKEI
jgi:hypothetical protein